MPKRKSPNAFNEINKPIIEAMVQEYKKKGLDFDYQAYIKDFVGTFIQAALKAELDDTLGYSKYERTPQKKANARNGFYPKTVTSSFGDIDLAIPRDRAGEYTPTIVAKGQTDISGIEKKIIDLYGIGNTTRDIAKQIEELYNVSLSPAEISRITDKILPEIQEWKNRPLQRMYAYIFMDAAYFNVRDAGRNVKKACYTAMGVNMQGQREVLGMWIGNSESASYWCTVLQELKARGVQDVLLFAVDGLHGMVQAIHAVYPDALVQRCIVHQLRNCFKLVPYKDRRAVAHDMKEISHATTLAAAENALDEFETKWGAKYPRVIRAWRDNWTELSTYYSLPIEMRSLIYTTNAIESYNRGLRKYTKNHVLFPNDQALEKLLYLAMLNITEKWHGQVYRWHSILNQLLLQYPDRIHDEDLELVL